MSIGLGALATSVLPIPKDTGDKALQTCFHSGIMNCKLT